MKNEINKSHNALASIHAMRSLSRGREEKSIERLTVCFKLKIKISIVETDKQMEYLRFPQRR